jgi:diguanylate cyclase (GGDEF)-like protein
MSRIQKLIHVYGNPMEWTAATKAALLLSMTLAVHLQYFLWAYYQISELAPEVNHAYVNTAFIKENIAYLNGILVLSLSLLLLVLFFRKRFPDSEFHEYLASQYYAFTLSYFGYMVGTLSIATGVVIAGAPMVGFILFNRRAVMLAFIVSIAAQWGVSYFTALGELSYAPLVINLQEPNGSLSYFWLGTMYYFAAPHLIGLIVFAYHVLSLWRQREEEVRLLSLTDPLTRLSNRRSILSNLSREHERSRRHGPSFSLLLVDLDYFKKVNDTWGHPAGDQVLVEASKALKAGVRQNDHVGRYGGEEFLIILPGTDIEGAYQLAERCRKQLETLQIDIGGEEPITITGSMGLFCNEKNRDVSAEKMLHNADEALYKAKESGRNCVIKSENEKDVLST